MTSCVFLHNRSDISEDLSTIELETYSLYARDISQARYTIFLSRGRNWLRYLTHWVYSSSNFDSRGTGSRLLMRFRIVMGAP